MDFKDTIKQLSERVSKLNESIMTEEATKNAFIMPMITALGYDVFDPFEVVPEMDCDLIKKKGEKIDYAIMKDGEPILLIECKHCKQDLDLHDTQLQKYFVASKSRFCVLTNGIEYRFYSDLDKPNIMDVKPFLCINMLDLSETDIEQLKKFHKSYYNENEVLSTANELKYTTEIKSILNNEFDSPSQDFVRLFAKQSYTTGQITSRVIDMFTPLVKKSITSVINDIISDRLKNAIKNGEEVKTETDKESKPTIENESEILPAGVVYMNKETGIVTTQEEIDAFNIVRSILRENIDVSRIQYTDYKTLFQINISGFYICKLYFGERVKRIMFRREKEWTEIKTIDDIFKYSDKLKESLNKAEEALSNYTNNKN
ncbi:MAG: type I restriction endonuclease [Bacteroidales bacterium]|nr:type I restriction endonuclease [Bacteroidales bacterium]